MQIVTSPLKKKIYKFLFFAWSWSARQQMSFGYYFDRGAVSSITLSLRVQAK